MKKFLSVFFLMTIFLLTGCGGSAEKKDSAEIPAEEETAEAQVAKNVSGELVIKVLNVGQGDATLIQTKTQTILIDTSDTDERELLVNELEKAQVTKIDKLILTHPHADHIGNAKVLISPSKKEISANPYLEKISVDEVYDNGIASTSPIYKSYMKAIESAQAKHFSLTNESKTLDFGGGVKFEILYPTQKLVDDVNGGKKSDPNNESIVGRLVYKKFAMMFTGDAEKVAEQEILKMYKPGKLKSTILKSGHHGSYTASTKNFVKNVAPEFALISCGPEEERRNTYGHPHLEPLENYLELGIDKKNILCTRWNGTITVTTDGKNVSVESENDKEWIEEWTAKKKKEQKK